MKRITFFLPLITLFLLTACAPQPQSQDAVVSAVAPTATATPASEPTFTPTPTATFTPTSTPTVTPTPTPTLITLPVRNGTPVPDLPYEVITADNVHRLREVARYGFPRLLDENPYRLTADGKTIAVGTTAGIEFYDAATHQKTGGFEIDFLRRFDMTPDGRFILTLAGESLSVWTAQGERVQEFSLEVGSNWSGLANAALSPDGSLLAVQQPRGQTADDKVDVYRVSDGTLLDTVRGMGVQFSPDGKYLATVFDSNVRLYPAAELGKGWEKRLPKDTLPWSTDRGSLAFSPDGTLAAVVRKDRVDVYQVETRRLVRQVSGWMAADYNLPQVSFSPDGGQVMIQTQSRFIVVEIASGNWLADKDALNGFVWSDGEKTQVFAWKAEGEMPYINSLFVSDDGNVTSWGRNENSLVQCSYTGCKFFFDSENEEKYISFDGKMFSLLQDGNRRMVIDENGQMLVTFSADKNVNFGVDVYRDVVLITYYSGRSSWTNVLRKDGKKTAIQDIVFNIFYDDNFIALDTYKTGAVIIDIDKWAVRIFPNESAIGFYKKTLISAFAPWSNQTVRLVDVETRKVQTLDVPRWKEGKSGLSVGKGVLSNQGVLFVDSAGTMYVFDVSAKKLIREFAYSNDSGGCININERFLVTSGYDGFIRVWAVVPQDSPVR